MALPDIPRLYTALAECLSVLLITPTLVPRFSKMVTAGVTLLWAAVLSAFLGLTGNVPGRFWIPCMAAAIGLSYLYLWGVWHITLLEAGYHCARAFILAELAASVEWQLHCALWSTRSPWEPLSLLLLVLVYGALFGGMSCLLHRRPQPAGHLEISGGAALTAVTLALTAFAVSNLGFLPGSDINMSIFSIRTLVDFSGVLILTVQHEQLRENALHGELAAMDEVLHRQYEQYKRSKEGINLINRRYHELKIQLARIREEQDQAKQNAAIAAVRAEPDPEKRLVKVAVYSQGGFAMLRFEHYTETAPALDADGLPQGTDLKSVRTAVQQHGGSMTLHWENNWCTLRILFPLPKNK